MSHPSQYDVGFKFVIDSLYYVDTCSLYSWSPRDFYPEEIYVKLCQQDFSLPIEIAMSCQYLACVQCSALIDLHVLNHSLSLK